LSGLTKQYSITCLISPTPLYHHRYNYSDMSQKNCLCQNQVNRSRGVCFFANTSVKFESTFESPRDFAIAIHAPSYTPWVPMHEHLSWSVFKTHSYLCIPETIGLLIFTPCAWPICLRRWWIDASVFGCCNRCKSTEFGLRYVHQHCCS